MQITSISYEPANDRFSANLSMSYGRKVDAVLEISYDGSDRCTVQFNGKLDNLRYPNATCVIVDVLRTIADAQEAQAAELPSDLELPIHVRNTFVMPTPA